MAYKLWVYEERCRRCGNIKEYSYGNTADIPFEQFNTHMIDKTNSPRCHPCDTCGRDTVVDIVSYGEKEYDE